MPGSKNVYHRGEHSALGTTPLVRWQKDIDHVRPLPPGADLRRLFFHRLDRLVRRDSTFLLHGRLYEAPAHLAGRMLEVWHVRNTLDFGYPEDPKISLPLLESI